MKWCINKNYQIVDTKRFGVFWSFQDAPYPMDLPNLDHAVIMNNVAEEMPGSQVDVEALRSADQKVGFEVHVHSNCTDLVNYFAFFQLS